MKAHIPIAFSILAVSSALLAQSQSFCSPPRPIPRAGAFFGLHFDLHPNNTDVALGVDVSEEKNTFPLERIRPDYVQ
jgi:hypothetical protein